MSSTSTRIGLYKNSGIKNMEVIRRGIKSMTIKLRKARKDEQLTKRRNISVDEEPTNPIHESTDPTIKKIVEMMDGSDPTMQLVAIQTARRMMSVEGKEAPISTIIEAGIMRRCVSFLGQSYTPDIQVEAAWLLTNVAGGSSDQTKAVVTAGAVPHLVTLLSSGHPNVAEHAVWALGNIAGDGPSLRDCVISSGVIEPLLQLNNPTTTTSFLRDITWTMSNLCRNDYPSPPLEAVLQLIPTLCQLAYHTEQEVLTNVCVAFSYVTEANNEMIQEVIDSGVVQQLVQLLEFGEPTVVIPALRAVGNVVSGTDSQTDSALQCGILPKLQHLLLTWPNDNLIVKEVAWIMSNITAGNVAQIQAVIDGGLLHSLREILAKGDFRSKKEAARAITNCISGGTVEQVIILYHHGITKPLCDLLSSKDCETGVQVVVLDGLANLMEAAKMVGEVQTVTMAIEECGGLDKIENLQSHQNELVYHKALDLVETYFGESVE